MATILVADDNSNIQKMVTLALKDQGINVVAVGNGEAAVRKLPDAEPDLVLADIFMPVRNGYEVCEFVKHDPRFAHIPVILLVGAFDPLDEREAQRVGADGVLKKPFVPPEPLIAMVKALLAKPASPRLVPVVAVVAPSVGRASAEPVAVSPKREAPPFPMTPAEPAHEAFGPGPERFDLGKSEIPPAFGELPEAQAVETAPKPEVTAEHETGVGEAPFWASPLLTEEPTAEIQEAGREEEFRVVPEEEAHFASSTLTGEQSPPAERFEVPPEGILSAPGLAEFLAARGFDTAIGQTEASAPSSPSAWELAAQEATEPAAEAPWSMPEVPAGPDPGPWRFASEPAAEHAAEPPPSAPEAPAPPKAGGWEVAAEQAAEPAAETPPSLAEPPAAAVEQAQRPAEPAPSGAVQSFAVPQPPDPQFVEAVVARVIEHMQPQIVEVVTREILKPVVEALVRRELEKL